MKKILSIVLAPLMVLGLAASAFAIHAEIPAETQAVVATGTTQITLGGELRTRGWWRSNIAGGLGQDTNDQAWWDQRVRLNVEAKVAPGVVGYVQLETESADSGDKYVWGHGANRTTGLAVNSKPDADITLLQAWILYSGSGLFGFNSGLKVGHMPLKLAYGQFLDNTQYGDDALVLFMDPVKGLHIGLLTFNGAEGLTRWWAVLKPAVALPTVAIFGSPTLVRDTPTATISDFLADPLGFGRNDLQGPAEGYSSEVSEALALLQARFGDQAG